MKKQRQFRHPPAKEGAPLELKEAALLLEEPSEMVINVRAAKDQLSSLLDAAASGNEVVITSDGIPKAKLVPMKKKRKVFRVDWKLLQSMPLKPGAPTAEQLIREERDSRP